MKSHWERKNDINELPMTFKVSGKFEEKRKPGEEAERSTR